MKRFIKATFYFTLCLIMIACTQDEAQTAASASPTAIVATSTIDSVPSTLSFLPLPDNNSLPTVLFDTTPLAGTPATPSLDQMQFPYFEQAAIPGLLQSHLTIETLPGLNGHGLQRISGWKYGFKSLEWMDTDHLLLYPVAGIYSIGGGQQPGVYPAVASLNSKTFWIPVPNRQGGDFYPTLPRWSAQLGVLIAAAPNTSVAIHSPDGAIKKVYGGNFLGVSPSATKLLIDDTWIDLGSGKTVQFAWQQTEMAAQYATYANFRPIWSPDEMRVYTCCYVYGNAETGESLAMPYNQITLDGEITTSTLEALGGTWVLDNKYMMPIWQGVWDGRYGAVFLFDPAAKTYRNLSKMVGLPNYPGNDPEPYCNRPSAQNGGRYVWVACRDGGHLIDLITFHSQTYSPIDVIPDKLLFADVEWSADGNFIWLHGDDIDRVLYITGKEMKLLPKNCSDLEWHPGGNLFLCLSNDEQSISLLDARTLKETTLTTKFWELGLSPDGKHIALLARDNNSLWQADYPDLDNLKQLTSPMPEIEHLVRNVVWSPDENALAFIGAQDIYVVQTDSKP